jgi:four helix bundle suffix protein
MAETTRQSPSQPSGFIPPHGGYRDLLSYRKTCIVYDGTLRFCARYVDRRSRTTDQMVQAKNSPPALYVRRLGSSAEESYATYAAYIDTRPAPVVANILICLIHQANYLLDRQIRSLEQAFLAEGGLRERMTRARLQVRKGSRQ